MEIIQREKFCGKKLKKLNDVCSHAFNSIIESNIHILMRNDNSRIDLSINNCNICNQSANIAIIYLSLKII